MIWCCLDFFILELFCFYPSLFLVFIVFSILFCDFHLGLTGKIVNGCLVGWGSSGGEVELYADELELYAGQVGLYAGEVGL